MQLNASRRLFALKVSLYGTLVGVFVLALLPAGVPLPAAFTISDVLNHGLAFFVISILFDLAYPSLGALAKIGAIMAYGGAMEIAQSFVPTRECSLGDVGVDLAATLLYFAVARLAIPVGALRGEGCVKASAGRHPV